MQSHREQAIREQVEKNLCLVKTIAKTMVRKNEDIGDLISYGVIGLRRACEKFDPSYNVQFKTYASYWIRQSIRRGRFSFSTNRPFSIPENLFTKKRNNIQDDYIDRIDIFTVRQDQNNENINLDSFPLNKEDKNEYMNLLLSFLDGLSDRERSIVRLYHGLDDLPGVQDCKIRTANRPTALIAKHLGISRKWVGKIYNDAMNKLREMASND